MGCSIRAYSERTGCCYEYRPEGVRWLIVMLALTFAVDTAYVTGRLIGRHILWPAVSPSKTWEGFTGGMLAGALVAIFLPRALSIAPQWPWLVAFAFVLPFAAIAGDFLESALKRRMGVKDMSDVLPGHGGLLDRLDSLLVVRAIAILVVAVGNTALATTSFQAAEAMSASARAAGIDS